VAAAPPAGGSVPPPPPQMQVGAPMADNVASTLCYVLGLITGIIFLVLAPYNRNPTVRFHAFQSIFLHVACIVFWIAVRIVMLEILHMYFLFFLTSLIWLAAFLLWIVLLLQTYQGKTIVLPIIGPIAQQQARM
jgi:uncharacterized membrane protein